MAGSFYFHSGCTDHFHSGSSGKIFFEIRPTRRCPRPPTTDENGSIGRSTRGCSGMAGGVAAGGCLGTPHPVTQQCVGWWWCRTQHLVGWRGGRGWSR